MELSWEERHTRTHSPSTSPRKQFLDGNDRAYQLDQSRAKEQGQADGYPVWLLSLLLYSAYVPDSPSQREHITLTVQHPIPFLNYLY